MAVNAEESILQRMHVINADCVVARRTSISSFLMTRYLFVIVLLVVYALCTLSAEAQGARIDNFYQYSNQIGVSFSTTTGSGLSYARRFGDALSAKVVGYYYMSENGENTNSISNVALELQYDLVRDYMLDNGMRIYLCGSARYYNEENSHWTYSAYNGSTFIDTTVSQSIFLNCYNFGLGIDLMLARRFCMNVSLGYGFRMERQYPEFQVPAHFPMRELLPTVGFELGYRF